MGSRNGLGRVAVSRILSGHRLGESVPKALKEEGRVETAVWTTLANLFGRRKGYVVHGEGRACGRRMSPRFLEDVMAKLMWEAWWHKSYAKLELRECIPHSPHVRFLL